MRLLTRIILVLGFGLPGTSYSETLRAYLITTPASTNVSEVHIINTADSSQTFTGTLFSGSGARVGASSVTLHGGTIQSQGRLVLTASDIADIFNILPWEGPAMMEVSADSDFKVMVKLRSPSGFVSNTNCVTKNAVHNIEGSDQLDPTYIRFINIGNERISDIRGSLHSTNGRRIGSANNQIISSLGPKEQVWISNRRLESIFNASWTGPATLDVSENENLRLLNLNYVNSETFFNFSCFEGTFEESASSSQNFSEPPWAIANLVGSWYGEGDAIVGLSNPDCINRITVFGTLDSRGRFSGRARNLGTNYSLGFSAIATSSARLLVVGMAVDYSLGYGASFSGQFLNESTLQIFGRDTNECYTNFLMLKQ
ncbi:MAG: hypothetical protein ACJ0Q2_05185 [Candidatus Azotimanducaceae bacterium]